MLRALLFLLACFTLVQAWAAPLPLESVNAHMPLGADIDYFKETAGKLTLEEARATFERGDAIHGGTSVLTTGIGSAPVWIHLATLNEQPADLPRRLTIENAWLDEIDFFFVQAGLVSDSRQLGDSRPFAQRDHQERFFSVDHSFKPGITDIYLRIATPDPMVVPVYLRDPTQAVEREVLQSYSYGILYGYLVALLAYNAMLFVSIRDQRYLLYAAFQAAFIALSMAYTGHGFRWLWPEHVTVQRWIIPNLMVLFVVFGLLFARSFLNTPRKLPKADRILKWLIVAFLAVFTLACAFGDTQLQALRVTFTLVLVFSVIMLSLGIWAIYSRVPNACYFLLASLASATGASLTALSVWGIVGFDEWRYRAVEIGMVIDATLLAIALGGRFRRIQLQRIRAEIASKELAEVNRKLSESLLEVEQLAATDRLTGLWNRRHFENAAAAEMERALRYKSATSLLIFDADHFKSINDTCGHQAGDEILKELAQLVRKNTRESDSVTRWGGEEFIVLMPNTNLSAAAEAGEKLRQAVNSHSFTLGLKLTISIGVAEWAGKGETLDWWIDRADNMLYQAKHSGRNCVVLARPEQAGEQVMQLHWNTRYESGNAEIDAQHRQLFNDGNMVLKLIPELAGTGSDPAGGAEALGVVDALIADVEFHFATEERILAENNWPGLAEHRMVHAKFLAHARGQRERLGEDPSDSVVAALVNFVVIELIANHVLRTDRSYFASV